MVMLAFVKVLSVENSFHNVCVADLGKYPDNQILQDIRLHIKCSCQ